IAAVEILRAEFKENAASLAAALARGSRHPLSQAIAASAVADNIHLRDWREIPGGGIEARQEDGSLARLGSLAWLQRNGVNTNPAEDKGKKWMAEGAPLVGLSTESSLIALFALRDPLKLGAAEVLEKFPRQGLKTRLVTGDNRRRATAIARQ